MKVICKFKPEYDSQRNNRISYFISGDKVIDQEGKFLFLAEELDKRESELFDRTTECFISSGKMFLDSLHKAKIIGQPIDEIAYKALVKHNLKGNETRFYWTAHERVMDKIIKNRNYDFFIHKSKDQFDQFKSSIDEGFPVMTSIWIKPWYPSGRGHLILVIGYEEVNGQLAGFYVMDPFGDCLSRYKNHNGDGVFYPIQEFKKMQSSPEDKPRYMGILRKTV